jgi:hypothetical protein
MGAVTHLVVLILGDRPVPQIAQYVIGRVPIKMPNDNAWLLRPDKRPHHQLVDS